MNENENLHEETCYIGGFESAIFHLMRSWILMPAISKYYLANSVNDVTSSLSYVTLLSSTVFIFVV